MTKPQQREQLFNSPEEVKYVIGNYRETDRILDRKQQRLQIELDAVRVEREEISRRVQELQNLDLFDN